MRLPSALLALAAVGILSSSTALAGGSIKVTSTLDGKKVLPQRTHWLARPRIAAAKVEGVDFLIDGKLRWIEHTAPYNYGGDDNGKHLGFLITTFLAPGRHRFSVRVVTSSGQKATDTVVARVLAVPAPPAELAGTWKRTVTPADLRKSGQGPPPAGKWTLVFDRVGAWHLDPLGSGLVNEYDVSGSVIHVYAPIQMAPCSDNGPCGVTRFGHHGIGGTDCREDGPFGSYTWSVTGQQLTLTAKNEPCGNRRAIWEGTWTRVG
jgi:hypothetical protein